MVGGGAIVKYSHEYGFMGLFVMRPEYRGRGIGRYLWYKRRDLLLSRLGDNAVIGMDGVLAMQPFYQKGGFTIAFKDERYERLGEPMEVSAHIRRAETNDMEAVSLFDTKNFGVARPQFIKPWMVVLGTISFIWEEHTEILGLAVLRKAAEGYKIGPLFAENFKVAEELYRACLNAAVGEKVYLDIPVINAAAVKLVNIYKATYVFECARMYYGTPPKTNWDKIYGITTFELG